jgi:metal-responsive CopG/Arc/MetJ family transcriptional regulator
MPSKKPLILFVVDEDLFNKIDDFRFKNRINSRSEAVRRLLEEALSKYDKQEKKPKK